MTVWTWGGPAGGAPASGDRSRENERDVGGWSRLRMSVYFEVPADFLSVAFIFGNFDRSDFDAKLLAARFCSGVNAGQPYCSSLLVELESAEEIDQLMVVESVARAIDRYDDVGVTYSLLLVVVCVAMVPADQQQMKCFGERAITSRWSFCLRELLSAGDLLRRRFDKLERCRFEVFSLECLLFAPADFIEGKELVPAGRYLLVLSAALIISRRWIWEIINRSVVRHLELF
ncbi:hypothetical protein F511_36428 [Dorcoceras hygrometricum]|uniref:Uncharacterized protein n=1 Tax=Dorcoceras hygrometricum TaxID=472368 RepID=A0A2Z7DF82_9LAMI|nr:hypothetical protein F511_36428 [Dorcoceras hygrometricum]